MHQLKGVLRTFACVVGLTSIHGCSSGKVPAPAAAIATVAAPTLTSLSQTTVLAGTPALQLENHGNESFQRGQ